MARNQCIVILLRKLVFLLIFFVNLGVICAKDLASTNGYVRREHSLSKPFQSKLKSRLKSTAFPEAATSIERSSQINKVKVKTPWFASRKVPVRGIWVTGMPCRPKRDNRLSFQAQRRSWSYYVLIKLGSVYKLMQFAIWPLALSCDRLITTACLHETSLAISLI